MGSGSGSGEATVRRRKRNAGEEEEDEDDDDWLDRTHRPWGWTPPSGICQNSTRVNLPEPRLVSTRFSPDMRVESNVATLMVMQFGQLLDHDLTFTPEEETEEGETACCADPSVSAISAGEIFPCAA